MNHCPYTRTTDRVVDEVGSRSQLGPVTHHCGLALGHPGYHYAEGFGPFGPWMGTAITGSSAQTVTPK